MTYRDQMIDLNFGFFHSKGSHEHKAGWYSREGFDGGPVDDKCHGPFNSQFDARKAMRLVFFCD